MRVKLGKLDSQGCSLHYRVRGQGPYLLLIHGLGSSGADWEFQARALESRFRIIIPDLPGTGKSIPAGRKTGKDQCTIAGFAQSLWALLDHLKAPSVNIIGFSLGGAVALEMALGQPERVLRLALINSLCSYRIDSLRKWLEARVPPVLVRLIGMRRMAALVATRLFPKPWQRPLRERAAAVISAARASSYLTMALALESWKSSDGFASLKSKTLVIAAEHDFTPLAEKKAMAAALGAQFVVVRGSRHGTPFDSTEATNACLSAFLSDRPLPHPDRWICDGAPVVERLSLLTGLTRQQVPGH
jgi:3-oxoadipate enol-lactonase